MKTKASEGTKGYSIWCFERRSIHCRCAGDSAHNAFGMPRAPSCDQAGYMGKNDHERNVGAGLPRDVLEPPGSLVSPVCYQTGYRGLDVREKNVGALVTARCGLECPGWRMLLSFLIAAVFVSAKAAAFELNYPVVSMKTGETTRVEVVSPSAESGALNINWTSNDPSIATVDEDGIVSGIEVGYTTITATAAEGGESVECVVLINAAAYFDDKDEEKSYDNGAPRSLLRIFRPAGWKATDKRPVAVLFHGGSWNSGNYGEMTPHCRYLASRGFVGISAQYGISSVAETIMDTRSCIRWIKANAELLGIDPDRVVSGGASAGGHLATVCYLGDGLDNAGDDTGISPRPELLLLFDGALELNASRYNQVVNAFGAELAKGSQPIGDDVFDEDAPPAIMFYGTQDSWRLAGHKVHDSYYGLGIECQYWLAEGQIHGFTTNQPEWRDEAFILMDRFLVKHGFLSGDPVFVGGEERYEINLPAEEAIRLQPVELGGPKKWLIEPRSVVHTSSPFSIDSAKRLIDGSGIDDVRALQRSAHEKVDSAMWTEGNSTAEIVLDLGEAFDLRGMHIWNHHLYGPTQIRVSVSSDSEYTGATFSESVLARPLQAGKYCQNFAMEADNVRLVKLILEKGASPVGLAEIRFSEKPMNPRINRLDILVNEVLEAEIIFDGEAESLLVEESEALNSWSLIQPEVAETEPGVFQVRLPVSDTVFYRFGNPDYE